MLIFWDNMSRFPRFFISVLVGFFLTIFNQFFELLKDPKKQVLSIIGLCIIFSILMRVLKLMLALN